MPLEEVCLTILAAGFESNCRAFLAQCPEPPTNESVESALETLRQVGAVVVHSNTGDARSTHLGEHLARIPVDVRLGKMLIFGALFRCIDPVLSIVASLAATRSPFLSTFYESPEARAAHASFRVNESDFLTLSNIWEQYRENSNSTAQAKTFCRKFFLDWKALTEIGDARRLYLDLLDSFGYIDRCDRKISSNSDLGAYNTHSSNESIVHAVVCAGTYPNIARILSAVGCGEMSMWHRQERVHFHSSSVNAKTRRSTSTSSTLVSFHEKFGTSNRVSVATTCFAHPMAVLLLGGPLTVAHCERKVYSDDLLAFGIAPKTGVLLRELRNDLDRVLARTLGHASIKSGDSDQASRSAGMLPDVVVAGMATILGL